MYIIRQAQIINEGKIFTGDILVKGERIEKIAPHITAEGAREINAEGMYAMPGAIDDQVHFREPGLTHKGNIHTESRAAVAGGVTSFFEMPNTVPQATTQALLQDKYDIAAQSSLANYSFFMGTSNNNADEVLKSSASRVISSRLPTSLGLSIGKPPVTMNYSYPDCLNRQLLQILFNPRSIPHELLTLHFECSMATVWPKPRKAPTTSLTP